MTNAQKYFDEQMQNREFKKSYEAVSEQVNIVSGAIGGFGLSIFDKASVVGLILLLPFLFLSFGIVLAYLKLNKLEILIKDLRNE
ncbi:MAG: hypothetical protein NTZ60_00185 [Campylobacterales bacterium]|nr:hypothetical protein [Campylobacterales bacterium]